jgi:hypothetical protein
MNRAPANCTVEFPQCISIHGILSRFLSESTRSMPFPYRRECFAYHSHSSQTTFNAALHFGDIITRSTDHPYSLRMTKDSSDMTGLKCLPSLIRPLEHKPRTDFRSLTIPRLWDLSFAIRRALIPLIIASIEPSGYFGMKGSKIDTCLDRFAALHDRGISSTDDKFSRSI